MIQEFKDEILDTSGQPDNKPRYRIRDNNGTILYDNITLEVATPVTQEGMNINKAKVENLQGDLYTQDRYNIPSYSETGMSLDLPLTSYENGKIINIIAPATLTNSTLNVNNLGDKVVNGNLIENKEYTLIYNGSSFDIQEHPKFSTETQAEDGTDNYSIMTPLRVKQAFTNYGKPSSNFQIKTGTISDGGTIPQTSGYSNYVYFVSINVGEYNSYADDYTSNYDSTAIKCSVEQSTRRVTAKVGWWKIRGSSSGSTSRYYYGSATANYIEIAWN